MEIFVPLTGVVCAVTGVASLVESRNRRRKEAEDRERLIKAGIFVASMFGMIWLLTRR